MVGNIVHRFLTNRAAGLPVSGTARADESESIGFDFSWTKPDPAAMADAGYEFAIGYVSPNPAKNLSARQVAAYQDVGISVGLVWESTAGRALDGRAAGAQDGRAAEKQANALGTRSTR